MCIKFTWQMHRLKEQSPQLSYGIPGKLFSVRITPPSHPAFYQPLTFFSVPIILQLWGNPYENVFAVSSLENMNLPNDLAAISEMSSYSTSCPTLDRISFVTIYKFCNVI